MPTSSVTPAAAVGGAGLDPVSAAMGGVGLITGIGSIIAQREANELNAEFNEKSLKWSKEQYYDSKRYNSAPNQVALLRAAGMNPAFMFGGAQAGHAVSTGGVSQIPQTGVPAIDLNGISSISRGITNNQVDAQRTEADKQLTQVQTKSREFDLTLDYVFKHAERNAHLNLALENVKKTYNEALLALAQKDVAEADEKMKKAQEGFYYALGSLNHWQAMQAEKEFQNFDTYFNLTKRESEARINFYTKSASNQAAQAYYATQQGKTVEDLRPSVVSLSKLQENWQRYENLKKKDSWWAEADDIVQNLRNDQLISDKIKQEYEMLQQRNDWYGAQQLAALLESVTRSFANVVGSVKGMRQVQAQEVRNAIDKEYNDFKMSGVDSYQSWKIDKKGNKVYTSGTDHRRHQ